MTVHRVQNPATQVRLAGGVLVLKLPEDVLTLDTTDALVWRSFLEPGTAAEVASRSGLAEDDVQSVVERLATAGHLVAWGDG